MGQHLVPARAAITLRWHGSLRDRSRGRPSLTRLLHGDDERVRGAVNASEGREAQAPAAVVPHVAELLDTAQRAVTPVSPTTPWPEMSLDEAYASQAAL